jgi:SAM-dependent methyltransferase
MNLLLAALLALPAQDAGPDALGRIRRDAETMAPLVTTGLARAFLEAGTSLPSVRHRTLYHDPAARRYLTDREARDLGAEARDKLKKVPVDEDLYYNTRYGSPMAYVRPLELLGKAGLEGFSGRKILDFGCGGLGPHRMMASLGAEVVGVDVDPMLAALYSEPEDQGAVKQGRVSLVIGRYPAEETVKARVGGGLDVFLAKNTLKRGYVHPESGRTFIDLGMDDASFLKVLRDALKPGGYVMIYNLGPAPSPQGQPYKPMADIRTPFSPADWEAAGFLVLSLDQDDTAAARAMGAALGWDKGPDAMNLATDLFATYTLARKR